MADDAETPGLKRGAAESREDVMGSESTLAACLLWAEQVMPPALYVSEILVWSL